MIVISGFLAASECTKFVFGRVSAPQTPLEELTALSLTPYLVKGGGYFRGRGESKGKVGKRKEREGKRDRPPL